MFNNLKKLTVIIVSLSMLSSCATPGPGGQAAACKVLGPKTTIGILGGAAAGAGLAGATSNSRNRGEAVLIGALIGAVAGGMAGKAMDVSDCKEAATALQRIGKMKTGKEIVWNNPKTGNHGVIKPTTKITKTAEGMCREYIRKSTIDGKVVESKGTTCRMASGDWYAAS